MKAGRILFLFKMVLLACWMNFQCSAQPVATNAVDENSPVKAERDAAVHQVEKIVNQPVTAYRRARGMQVSKFEGGWFHAGASRPDFNNVDVRKTRETAVYEKSQYVTSDLNPGLVWLGKDLEFNAMTKQFYTNRNVPKKKLTEEEMVEINRLYRIIGDCEKKLLHQENVQAVATAKEGDSASATDGTADSASTETKRPRLLNAYLGGGAALLLVAILIAKSLLKK